ncbi:MAG: tail fiber domain-containing protein, partial [Parcubacteria group bacterium]|nr:tail fiber domain-containing protein [Parcubacteria group bacterium]
AGAGDIYATFATANTETLCWDASGASLITDCTSLSKFKENVQDLSLLGLATVMQLKPREYDWIGKEEGIRHDLGFVAEEVEAVNPLLASYNYDKDGVLMLNGVKYDRMSALFALSLQEIGQRIDLTSAPTSTPSLVLDYAGNVGIGIQAPSFKLQVAGDVAAQAFVNVSTQEAKKDISFLGASEEEGILAKITGTSVATYYYNDEQECGMELGTWNLELGGLNPSSNNQAPSSPKCAKRLGLIAEQAPAEVLSFDGKGVDLYKMVSFAWAGIKAQQGEIDSLSVRVSALESGNSIGPISPISPITNTLKQVFVVAKATLATITNAMSGWVNGVLAENTVLVIENETAGEITYKTFGVESGREEIVASGSATLTYADDTQTNADGQRVVRARVKFDESFVSIISDPNDPNLHPNDANIKVIVTPTSRLNGGLYVHEKSRFGFEVRQINAQDEGGTFDWLVIARKRGAEGAAISPIEPISPIGPIEEVAPPPAVVEPAPATVEPAPVEEATTTPPQEISPISPIGPIIQEESAPPAAEELVQ